MDDDSALGEALGAALVNAGYTVEVIGDGREALARLEQSPPDILLLDVVLPGRDGREVLCALRGKEETRRLPVIAITGAAAELEQEVRSLGADDFLVKPFSPTALMEILDRFLGSRPGTGRTD